MRAEERKFFLCTGQVVKYSDLHKYPASHIIGELRYLTDEGKKVTSLALYDVPACANQVPPLKPEIRLYVIGDSRMIKCMYPISTEAKCGRLERWEIGKAAFQQLMQRYAPKVVV
jgi:hypothetical protein